MKRGNLLWTGSRMMLSEHRQLLNERLKQGDVEEDTKLEIDQQKMEEWQEIWDEATENHSKVFITYDKLNKRYLEGYIIGWSIEEGSIYLLMENEERRKLLISKIIDFKLVD